MSSKKIITQVLSQLKTRSDEFGELIVVHDKKSRRGVFGVNNAQKGVTYISGDFNNIALMRNVGLSAAHKDILVFLDDDVLIGKKCLDQVRKFFKLNINLHKNTVAMIPQIVPTGLDQWSTYTHYDFYSAIFCKKNNEPVSYFPSIFFAVRNNSVVKNIRFDPSFKSGEDMDYSLRLFLSGCVTIYNPTVQVMHQYADNMLSFFKKRWWYAACQAKLAQKHSKYFSINQYLFSRKLELLFPWLFFFRLFLSKSQKLPSNMKSVLFLPTLVDTITSWFSILYSSLGRKLFINRIKMVLKS